MLFAEQQGAGYFENLLIVLAESGLLVKVVQHGLALREAAVDVLGVDADLAAVAPAHVSRQRLEGVHDRAQESRFALAVIADDRGARAVIDLQLDVGGDLPFRVADGEVAAPQRRASARFHPRSTDTRRGQVERDFRQFEFFERLALRLR